MAATNDIFNTEVFGKRNFEALDHIYTADARILPPGAPIIAGREAIKRFWKDLVIGLDAQSGVLVSVDVMPAGDDLVEIGSATLTVGRGDATAQVVGKYVVYWRQEEGRWKWHVDIWNMNA